MNARSIGGAAAAAAIVAVSFTTVTAQRGQGAAPPDNAPMPRMADGHPDLNGWCGPAGVPRMGFPNKIVMKPTEDLEHIVTKERG